MSLPEASTVRSGGTGSRHLLIVSRGRRQKDAPPRSAASAPPKPLRSINTPSRTLTMSSGCDASRSEREKEEEGNQRLRAMRVRDDAAKTCSLAIADLEHVTPRAENCRKKSKSSATTGFVFPAPAFGSRATLDLRAGRKDCLRTTCQRAISAACCLRKVHREDN